jgi:N-acetylmuramoyl-L-alanine amidase
MFTRRLILAGLLAAPMSSALANVTPKRKPLNSKLPVLVLDPGHGGKDPGAVGANGLYEKNVVLDMALRLAFELEGEVDVKLTREDDRFLTLGERVSIARTEQANLFISLHADSAPVKEARGLSAYTLSETASDSFAAHIAEDQNMVDARFGKLADKPEIANILMDLTAEQTVGASRLAKKRLLSGVRGYLDLMSNPARQANFAVLRAPDVPSVLLETGFLSNPKDAAALAKASTRQQMAKVLAREIAPLLHDPLLS